MPIWKSERPTVSKIELSAQDARSSRRQKTALRISSYDRAASMLLALLILVGSTVSLMFIIWISNKIHTTLVAVPVVMDEVGTGDGSPAGGGGTDLDQPATEDVPQETNLQEPQLKDTLSMVASAVQDRADLLDDPTALDRTNPGRGGGTGGGIGTGHGKGIGPGSGTGGRPRHWELRFPRDNTLDAYAKQLDFFGIELGVLLPGNKVQYAYHLSKSLPDQRTGVASDEKRFYLTWRRGELEQADRELLARAKIDTQNRLILKFLPVEIEKQLWSLEKARAGQGSTSVPTTVFGIQPEGNGYSFYVIEQTFR
jgi:hypothetical protein